MRRRQFLGAAALIAFATWLAWPQARPQIDVCSPGRLELQQKMDHLIETTEALGLSGTELRKLKIFKCAKDTFRDRWPAQPFRQHGHLPRAPLMPWWIERVIV